MNYKLRQLERVKRMREARERLSEVSLAVAATKLHDAEQRLSHASEAEIIGAQETVCALEAGEKHSMSLALREAFGMDRERYETERSERKEEKQQAQVILRARRIESEQAILLHRDMRSMLSEQEERRAQTETVDRFLARSRWNSAKVRVRSLSEAA
jgi:hypothetical protein